jgi:hypothetical protein
MLQHRNDLRIPTQRRHIVETHTFAADFAGREGRSFLHENVMTESMFPMRHSVNARSLTNFSRELQNDCLSPLGCKGTIMCGIQHSDLRESVKKSIFDQN